MRYCRRFLAGIPHLKADNPRVPHPSATRFDCSNRVRLACVRHAASVYPEPGSNSPSYVLFIAPIERKCHSCVRSKLHNMLACSQIRLLSAEKRRSIDRNSSHRMCPLRSSSSSAFHSSVVQVHSRAETISFRFSLNCFVSVVRFILLDPVRLVKGFSHDFFAFL
jgi:hypothetical protein